MNLLKYFMGLCLLLSLIATSAPAMAVEEEAFGSLYKKKRQYPGGVDDEDLKVQENLNPPKATADRRSIEQRVLKSYLKKTEVDTGSKKKSE